MMASALPIASMVSCKDYSEEIKRLNDELAADKQSLTDAQTAINAQIQTLKEQLATVRNDSQAQAEQIANLNTALSTLQSAQENVHSVLRTLTESSVDKASYAIQMNEISSQILIAQTAAQNAQRTADENLTKAQTAIAEAARTAAGALTAAQRVQNEFADYKSQTEAALDAQKKNLEEYKRLLEELASKTADKTELLTQIQRIDQLVNSVTTLSNGLANMYTKQEIDDHISPLREDITKINARLDVLSVLGGLRGLVLEPESYYNGLQAIEHGVYNLHPFTLTAGNLSATVGTTAVKLTPPTNALYLLNPSNADVKTDDLSAFKYMVMDRKMTRATEVHPVNPVINKASVADGRLKLNISINGYERNKTGDKTQTPEQVTVMALNYTKDKVSVTSEYAALFTEYYNKLSLYDAKSYKVYGAKEDTLGTTAAYATPITVVYNDTLELSEMVNTYRTTVSGVTGRWDRADAQPDNPVEEAGFKYEYKLVSPTGYKDAAYFTLGAEGRLIPHLTDGKTQSLSTKGKVAYVLITLRHTATNTIAAVGYYKVVVTAPPTVRDLAPGTKPYTMQCDGQAIAFRDNFRLSDDDLKFLYDKTNMTSTKFWCECDYTYEARDGSTTTPVELKQYHKVGNEWKEHYIGRVTFTPGECGPGHLTWTIPEKEAAALLGTEISTYVKLHNDQDIEFLFRLIWRPGLINNKPAIDFALVTDPINEFWNKSVADKTKGNDEVRMHVNLSDVTDFSLDLESVFAGNDLHKDMVAALASTPYKNLILKGYFTFVLDDKKINNPAQGAKRGVYYDLKLQNADTEVTATPYTLSGSTKTHIGDPMIMARIVDDTKVVYENNAYSKDLLNYEGHDKLQDGETFRLRVRYNVIACPDGDGTRKAVVMTNNEFNVLFLRPFNVVGTVKVNTTDAITPANAKIEMPITMTFTDWRKYEFAKYPVLYKLYQVQSIEALTQVGDANCDWTTSLNGGELGKTLLRSVTKDVNLVFVSPTGEIAQNNWGKVIYTAPTQVLDRFFVRIPVKVVYYWGTQYTYVDVEIARTQGNARQK